MIATVPAPRLISWNITLRCPLKCAHCYVDAGDREAEGVLSTEEAFCVIDQIREIGRPIVVLSGGEPLMREDLYAIAEYGTRRGLRMVLGSSGFLIDRQAAGRLRRAGIRAAAISIDSVDPAVHDAFRGMDGVWEKAVQAVGHCLDAGIGVQVNMSVMRPDFAEIEGVIGLGSALGVRDYHLFLPVQTGRGRGIKQQSPREYEDLIRRILLEYRESALRIRPICAPQFRRIADELGIDAGWSRGCLAGLTYCRIFATGDVTPCPYLPVSAGNLLTTSFGEIWQHSAVFAALRDTDRLTGKCGRCTYKAICGGCRARAYRGAAAVPVQWCDGLEQPQAPEGEICAEDPFCPYEPGEGVR